MLQHLIIPYKQDSNIKNLKFLLSKIIDIAKPKVYTQIENSNIIENKEKQS